MLSSELDTCSEVLFSYEQKYAMETSKMFLYVILYKSIVHLLVSNFRINFLVFFFFQAEDGIRDKLVTGVQTCALPIRGREDLRSLLPFARPARRSRRRSRTRALHQPRDRVTASRKALGRAQRGRRNDLPCDAAARAREIARGSKDAVTARQIDVLRPQCVRGS